jgi:hypothetical protein
MVERIIEFSAHNKFIVLILTAVAVAMAVYAMQNVPLDAIPDLSDTQVIVYSRWDRSPDIMEDQVTYPIITALLGAPKVKAIRGFSDFGFSYVYIIFQDGTDIYWARSRTLEYLSKILPRLPEGVQTEMGPDATGVGWVYQYALVDRSGKHDLAENHVLLRKHLTKEVRAEPAREKRAHEYVGVEKDPQERRRKTSSSVRTPAASPNGRALSRSFSNLTTRSCLRRRSRTSSLRVWPVSAQARSRSLSSRLSRRIVSVGFM